MAFYDDFEARRQQVLGNKTPSQIAAGANNGSTANSQFSASVNKGGTGTYSDFEKRRQQVLTAKPTVTTPTPTAKPTVTVTTPVAKPSTNPIQGVIDSIKKIADTAIAGLTGKSQVVAPIPQADIVKNNPANTNVNQPVDNSLVSINTNLMTQGLGLINVNVKNVFDSVIQPGIVNLTKSVVNNNNPIESILKTQIPFYNEIKQNMPSQIKAPIQQVLNT